ncbi:MAG: outer membrane protein multidrug efflux system [Gammaproteobacteria bacterium]|nr:outer membrane protein multidrug efflux system [Gammaproteobacteria bacterium]
MKAVASSFLCLLAALAGCAVGPNYRVPKPDTPPEFAAATTLSSAPSASVPAPDLASWWRSLEDTELNSLVERAIKSNPDLEIALTRLQQARTYEAVVVGHAVPELDATAAAGRGTGSDLTRGRAQQALRSADNSAGLQHINTIAGFDAVWELDLFGKFRREIEAARYDMQAAAAARNAVITSIVADVVRAYVDLRGFQTQVGILKNASDVLRESLRIVNIRYERGITNELDVVLARRELDTVEAQIAPLNAQVNALQYTLAVLVGGYPETIVQELSAPNLIPSMPAPVAYGVPLDLLKRRPDIQQAERELAAATARIGVATAELFPQVTLVGSIGSQGQGWGTAPSVAQHIWSFGPGAVWPLLDFGALDAKVDIARLAAHASLVNYRKTILTAVQEVDTALDAYNAQQDRLTNLGDAMLAAQRAVDLAKARYDRGLTDFLNVVDAERQFYTLQEQYAAGQVTQGEEFVRLYKNLGGGWQNYQAIPDIRRPQPAIIAAFRRTLRNSAP